MKKKNNNQKPKYRQSQVFDSVFYIIIIWETDRIYATK